MVANATFPLKILVSAKGPKQVTVQYPEPDLANCLLVGKSPITYYVGAVSSGRCSTHSVSTDPTPAICSNIAGRAPGASWTAAATSTIYICFKAILDGVVA